MKNWCAQLLLAIVVALVIFDVSTALDITDGFGDGDRNNDGSITKYDSDKIPAKEVVEPLPSEPSA